MNVYCIPKVPNQNGSLWVKVSEHGKVIVMNPAGKWWRDKTFTLDEFRAILNGVNEVKK